MKSQTQCAIQQRCRSKSSSCFGDPVPIRAVCASLSFAAFLLLLSVFCLDGCELCC